MQRNTVYCNNDADPVDDETDPPVDDTNDPEADADDAPTPDDEPLAVTRPRRTITKPDVLTYNNNQIKVKTLKFADEQIQLLEMSHNLNTNVSPNPDENVEYSSELALVIARVMSDINAMATAQGASFGQQYILQKGLKMFGKRGKDATKKELDQLHQRVSFEMSIGVKQTRWCS